MTGTPKAIYESAFKVGPIEIRVFHLDNGQRVIEQESMARLLEWLYSGNTLTNDDAERINCHLASACKAVGGKGASE